MKLLMKAPGLLLVALFNLETCRAAGLSEEAQAQVLDQLVSRVRGCIREAQVAMRRNLVDDRQFIADFAAKACGGPLTAFMTGNLGRPPSEAEAYVGALVGDVLSVRPAAPSARASGRAGIQSTERADQNQSERFVDSVRSVAQAKEYIRDSIRAQDLCASGSCVNTNATEVCAYVAAIDVQAGGVITDSRGTAGSSKLRLVGGDLRLFRLLWAQCKPTTYQYWNFPSVLHVWYEPTAAADKQIRGELGIPPR
jgi:hypothetical protein